MERYRIELLQTAEGVNLKKDKTEDMVTVLLWAEDEKSAWESAEKIAKGLEVPTHMGMLDFVILSVNLEKELPITKIERVMSKRSKKDTK